MSAWKAIKADISSDVTCTDDITHGCVIASKHDILCTDVNVLTNGKAED